MSQVPVIGPGRSPVEGEKPKSGYVEAGPLPSYERSSIAPYSSEGGSVETPRKRFSILEYQSTIRNNLNSFYQSFLNLTQQDALLARTIAQSIGYKDIPTEGEVRDRYEKDHELWNKAQQYIDAYNAYLKKLGELGERALDYGESFEDVFQRIGGSSQEFQKYQEQYLKLKENADLSTPEGQAEFDRAVQELKDSSAELFAELKANYLTFSAQAQAYLEIVSEFNQAVKELGFTESEWNSLKALMKDPSLPDFPGVISDTLYGLPGLGSFPDLDFESFESDLAKAIVASQNFENLVSSALAAHRINEGVIDQLNSLKPLPPLKVPSFDIYQARLLNDYFQSLGQDALVKLAVAAGLQQSSAEEVGDYLNEFKLSKGGELYISPWGEKTPITGDRPPRSEVERAYLKAFIAELSEKILKDEEKAARLAADYTLFLEALSLLALRDAARLSSSMSSENAYALSLLKVLDGITDADIDKKAGGDQDLKRAYYPLIDHLKTQLTNYLVEENDITVMEKADKLLTTPHDFQKKTINPHFADYTLVQLLKGLDLLELGVEVRSEQLKTSGQRGTTFSV